MLEYPARLQTNNVLAAEDQLVNGYVIGNIFFNTKGYRSTLHQTQVLGGYGYTEDFILEQLARDIRIMSLYEGTTGIQSQALLGRQIPMHEGRALKYWKEEAMKDIERAIQMDRLRIYAERLADEIKAFENVTRHLLMLAVKGDQEVFLSDANLYMELFGLINLGWQWLKQASLAEEALKTRTNPPEEERFYHSKTETMQFFFHYELIKTKGLITRLMDEKILTVWKAEDSLI
ncbi:MAG: acyl-CoA dehydrogenase [Chitinophagales bacterium]